VLDGVVSEGLVEVRPGDDDPGAIALMQKLSVKSRKRWPEQADPAPALIPPPKKKPAAAAPAQG
jgi:coenzyme F420 hydrogenase subunit beta